VLVIYVNLRESSDSSGYPHRDDVICRMLSIPEFPPSKSEFEKCCCAFFAAIFQTIRERVKQGGGDWNTKVEALKSISKLNSPERDSFFHDVFAVENFCGPKAMI
jgi:hypothetical protein